MEVRDLHRYDRDVETVFALFVDAEAMKAKQEATGARNVKIRVSGEGDRREVFIEREVPADVPRVLKKFLGAWNKVVQKERWVKEGESWRGEFSIDVSGAPLKISCTTLLRPEGEGSVAEIVVRINSGIPIVGRKLEAIAADSTRTSMVEEYRFLKGALATE